jgi:glycosyltransferase involved in cell wall biosynthesis
MPAMAAPLRVHALIASLTWGGAETLLAHLAAGAPAAGLELSVGYLLERDGSPAAAALRARGVEPRLVGVRSLLGPADLLRVRRHVAAAAPDVLHTHLGYADLMGGVAARSLGLPCVATVHVMQRSEGARERVKDELMALARRRCAGRVICVSQAARRWYLDTGWDRPDRVLVVPNGVAAAGAERLGRDTTRAALGLGADDLVVAMVAVLRPGKGHDVAVAAMTTLRARLPRARLLILGDGPGRRAIARLAAPLGDAVVLAGHRDDVPSVLAAADAVLHPTAHDAFPSALLEAMAAGLPAVATAVGGIPEIVRDGETGVLVPAPARAGDVAAALERLLGDAGLRAAMGAAGRRRFEERFSADRWAQRLRDAYEAAGARPGARAHSAG